MDERIGRRARRIINASPTDRTQTSARLMAGKAIHQPATSPAAAAAAAAFTLRDAIELETQPMSLEDGDELQQLQGDRSYGK